MLNILHFITIFCIFCDFQSSNHFSALEVFYENALYKFTFDTDIDIDIVNVHSKHCHHT